MAVATIIAKTVPDLGRIVTATEGPLGFNATRVVDELRTPPHPSMGFALVLGQIGPPNTPAGFYARHSTVSVLIAMDDADFPELAAIFSGMSLTTTMLRRGMLLVATANLRDWQLVVEEGLAPEAPDNIRAILTAVYHAFEADQLRLWNHMDRSTDPFNNIYLEAK